MDELAEPEGVLFISSIVGGVDPKNRPWSDAIRGLYQVVKELGAGVESDLRIDVVFHVPGHILAPEFEGVRTGSFRRRDALLMVQVALPAEVPIQPAVAVSGYLYEVLDAAFEWAVKRRKKFDFAPLVELVEKVDIRLREKTST